MSVQDILDTKEDEIKLIHQIITHRAGFIIDLFGGMITIRSHSDGFEVAWQTFDDSLVYDWHRDYAHHDSLEAVTFFVEKRHALQCGIDFEGELMKEKHNE